MKFNNRLRTEMDRIGITMQVMAEKSGVSRRTIESWLRLTNPVEPGAEKLYRVAQTLGVSTDFLLSGDEAALPDDEFVKNDAEFHTPKGVVVANKLEPTILVPIAPQRLSAGPGQEFLPPSSYVGQVSVLKRMTRGLDQESLVAAEVRGDSMTGMQLYDGDIAIFTKSLTDGAGEGVYVISLYGEVKVKRLEFRRTENQIIIHSENPRYSPEEVSMDNENLRILGKVVGWIHCHPF